MAAGLRLRRYDTHPTLKVGWQSPSGEYSGIISRFHNRDACSPSNNSVKPRDLSTTHRLFVTLDRTDCLSLDLLGHGLLAAAVVALPLLVATLIIRVSCTITPWVVRPPRIILDMDLSAGEVGDIVTTTVELRLVPGKVLSDTSSVE